MRNRTGESFLEGDTTQYWSTDRPLIGMPTFLTFACTCELYWYFDNRLKGCPDKPVERLSKTVARADGRFICFLGVLWPPYGTACIGHALSAYNSRRSIQLQYTRPWQPVAGVRTAKLFECSLHINCTGVLTFEDSSLVYIYTKIWGPVTHLELMSCVPEMVLKGLIWRSTRFHTQKLFLANSIFGHRYHRCPPCERVDVRLSRGSTEENKSEVCLLYYYCNST